MSIVEAVYRTITCNTCEKSVTFDPKDPGDALETNPWIKTTRIVQRIVDGRNFAFCSDECELKSVAAGQHNPEEPKKVVAFPGGAQAIAQAAAAAKAQEESNRALKSGSPVTLHGG